MTLNYRFSLPAVSVFILIWMASLFPGMVLFAADANLCTGITVREAAGMLGVPESDIRAAGHEIPVSPDDIKNKVYKTPPCNCSFRSTTDFLKSVNYVVYVFSSDKQAVREFNTMKANYETVSQTQAVAETGDMAFRVDDKRFQRMVGLKKNVLVDVLSPKTAELQQQIIEQVLKTY